MIWTFNSTKKITKSQKTNPEFKKQIPRFSVIAHILMNVIKLHVCGKKN
jgi:hypothetical protein